MTFAAALASFALATPVAVAPVPLRHDRDARAVALAGPDVLVLSEHGDKKQTQVVAVPRTGGKARTLLTAHNTSPRRDVGSLAASPQRVAALVETDGKTPEHRVYGGPPSGPLQLVVQTPDPRSEGWYPDVVDVDGDRMLLVEQLLAAANEEDDDATPAPIRVRILDANGWTPVAWATSERVPIAIAGNYAAVAARNPPRLEVADLTTGTPLVTLNGKWTSHDLDVQGRVLAATDGGLQVAGPGEPQHAIASFGKVSAASFAGASFALFDDAHETFDLVGADGAQQPLGPPSLIRTDLDADESGAAWLTNGCLRYAPLQGSAASQEDPCPASELAMPLIAPESKLEGDAARMVVRCVASTTARCRGRLIARLDRDRPIVGRGTFDIPVGKRLVKVAIHFDRNTIAKFRHDRSGSVVVNAVMHGGTVGAGADYNAELGVKLN